jgi:histidinol dehydrogenase
VMKVLRGRAAVRQVTRLAQRGKDTSSAEKAALPIIRDVRRNGDAAVRKYAQRWDKLQDSKPLRIAPEEMQAAWDDLSTDMRAALQQAATRIRQFCRWQMPREWNRTAKGIRLGQIIRPLESVGCYVPGGQYPLPSTLLMTVIPAEVAGVRSVRVASPNPQRATMAAAAMLGVREFYRVGGAQAVAAFAYGTKSIPRVQKIVGPGNRFVTAAKKLVSSDCAIDMLAGPTEAVILLHEGTPAFIASDLVAQAEHDPATLPVLITRSPVLARDVVRQVLAQSADNPNARTAWETNGTVLLAASHEQALEWANQIAPEHITVSREDVSGISSAGSIFIGDYSAQAAGDYATGPNHVLPTGGGARLRGGLSVLDFVKLITVQELDSEGANHIASTVIRLAELEGLHAHARSMQLRCTYA